MKIKLDGSYKSLYSFESEPLADFTVITGKNGCGKTQLLQLIPFSNDRNVTSENRKILGESIVVLDAEIKKIQKEGIKGANFSLLRKENWKDKIDIHINGYNRLQENTRELALVLFKSNIWVTNKKYSEIINKVDRSIITEEKLEILMHNALNELAPNISGQSIPTLEQVGVELIDKGRFNVDYKTIEAALYVAKYRKKDVDQLKDVDFYNTPIPEHLMDQPELFGSQLDYLFYNYAKRRAQNRESYFYKVQDGDYNDAIPDSDFILKFIPPWELINKILSEHKVGFEFTGIKKEDFSPDADISFKLIKQPIGTEVKLQELSSGEKIILGLITKLFTSDYYKDDLEFPELILLDEPDAYLHPEMCKLLIDVLNETFVKKLGIKVIMTTHSPTTVALCPEDSIYELQNVPTTSLKHIGRDKALDILTGYLPTLSIDYKNHKQVFAESPTDVKYYQIIFNKLNQDKSFPFKLYFISNSMGKGNCDQVKKIVADLRESGNTTCYGIIDWDKKNKSKDFIKVHGEGKRYSIESYLYDPIYISILLMKHDAHNIYNELGIDQTFNEYKIEDYPTGFLQKMANWFFDKYYEEHKAHNKSNSQLEEIEYLSGEKINVPKWFLENNGHDFEKRIKKVFAVLEGKYKNEGKLQEDLSIIIGKCYPLIPKDSANLIEIIMNA